MSTSWWQNHGEVLVESKGMARGACWTRGGQFTQLESGLTTAAESGGHGDGSSSIGVLQCPTLARLGSRSSDEEKIM
jgi:hypothetical protein